MSGVSTQHQLDLAHHVRQGMAWLCASAEGEHTADLSYAAFELRFAVERVAVYYWATLLDRRPEEHDLRDIRSFKRVERRIYDLAGHQGEIDRHFEFMRIVLGALKVEMPLHTPKIGELSRYWHECSELCHIAWPLSCSALDLRTSAYGTLISIAQALSAHVSSLGWPVLREVKFTELRNQFMAGEATSDDVLAYMHLKSVWARAEFPDGRPSHFVGEPLRPDTTDSS